MERQPPHLSVAAAKPVSGGKHYLEVGGGTPLKKRDVAEQWNIQHSVANLYGVFYPCQLHESLPEELASKTSPALIIRPQAQRVMPGRHPVGARGGFAADPGTI